MMFGRCDLDLALGRARYMPPLQGLGFLSGRSPRALPWAITLGPVGAEDRCPFGAEDWCPLEGNTGAALGRNTGATMGRKTRWSG